jgi:ribose transport system permease protein
MQAAQSVLLRIYSRYAVLPILVAVLIIAQVEDKNFFTWSSFQLLLQQNASLGIIAIGLTFVLIGGGIDISVGAIYAVGASVYTKTALHHSLYLALLAALGAGLLAGLVNGLLVTRLKFNPFVATLGTASLIGGLVVIYAGNNAVVPTNGAFGKLGNDSLGGLNYSVILLLVVIVLGIFVLHRTAFGKSIFAVGGSPGASLLAGLRTDALRLVTYLISGACAAIAGVVYASQTGVSESDLGGNTVALTAVAIVVLGGTSLFGGEGAIWRTVVGFIILSSVSTLFTVLAISQPSQNMIEGGIVVVALILDATARNRGAA